MPYDVSQNPKGRWVVTSPAGKRWKTTYASREAAMKGVDYVQSRFTPGPAAKVTGSSGSKAEERGTHTAASWSAKEAGW